MRKAHRDKLKSAIGDFNHVSVRNSETNRFVQNLTGVDAPIVADPTLLERLENDTSRELLKSEYILTYIVGNEGKCDHEKVLREIKNKHGSMPVKAIVIPANDFDLCDWADDVYYTLDPSQWTELIANAGFLYTDSFH